MNYFYWLLSDCFFAKKIKEKHIHFILNRIEENNGVLLCAESCTGGLIGKLVTDCKGSSNVFWGSLVTYSNDAKKKLLFVQEETLETFGAVSKETVNEMTEGLIKRVSSLEKIPMTIAVSGIAGPGGGTLDKPCGTVWIAVSVNTKVNIQKFVFKGSRRLVRIQTAHKALKILEKEIYNMVELDI